jgi:hypothetical protein
MTAQDAPDVPEYSYTEFCNYVRRFNQLDLLTAVVRKALALPRGASEPGYAQTPPWALAAMAKASICHGNPYRSTTVGHNDLRVGCFMYNNLRSDDLDQPGLNSGFGILVRVAYEQFPYQISVFEEVSRLEAFFGGYSGRKPLEIVNQATLVDLLGAPLVQAVGAAMILHGSAHANAGFFDPTWMDRPDFVEILNIVPRDDVLAVIESVFVNSFDEFKRQAADMPSFPFLDRYQVNPLTARPLVRLADGRLLAPLPQLILWKLSPLELYYLGVDRWGEAFTRDMGELVEDYVGRQFTALPEATVLPEIKYQEGKNTVKSVDWIVVFPDLILLVEAKATRVSAGARAGSESAKETYERTLGKALSQISRTYRAIQAGVPEFADIPTDRPVLGLVATLDPWYMANSLAREFLPKTEIPIMVASVREIEALVSIGQRRSASQILTEIMAAGDERQKWELETALRPYSEYGDANPLLHQAWRRYPFGSRASRNPASA